MSELQQVEKTVVCTNCGHPVWFTADEHDPHPCTDCGTINDRSQPDIWDGAEDGAIEAGGRVTVDRARFERLLRYAGMAYDSDLFDDSLYIQDGDLQPL